MKRSLLRKEPLFLVTFLFISLLIKAQRMPEADWKISGSTYIPVPPREHPRLFLRSTDIPQLDARLKEPVLKPVVDRLNAQAERSLQFRIELDAVNYLVSKDRNLGRKTIDSALVLLKRTFLPDIGDAARVTGRMMVTGAIVYDWIYGLLTPAEKSAFIAEFIRLAKTLECDYPPVLQGSVTGHSSESFVMRDMLSAGIAIYDEFPEMYDLAAGRFFREHLPARNWLYDGHAYHQGDSYGPNRYSFDTYPLLIFDRLGAGKIYNPQQQYVPYFYIYTSRADGQRMRGVDTFDHSAPGGRPWSQYVGTLFTASYYKDGILLEQFLKQGGSDGNENIFQFLWWDVNLRAGPVNTLPLTKYFAPPFGWMVARTGWDENSVIAEMKVNVYNFNNHQHLDAGSFQIYYKGPLATESGLYSGTAGADGSPHCLDYYWRTIAHNTILMYDPEEKFSRRGDYGNDGGQRLPNGRSEPRNLEVMIKPENGYKTGEVLAYGTGPDTNAPDYSYLKGDITRAYSSKVNDVRRSFVFLNLKNSTVPAALITFDRVVTSSSSYRKFWLLHSIDQPVIDGDKSTVSRSGNNESGKLVNKTLLPDMENLELTAVGGPGKEFWVFGKNYENEQRSGRENSYERAAWRVEASPRKPEAENYFLNVMQVMNNSSRELDVKRIDGEKVIGVRISDRIVVFSKNSRLLEKQLTFSIDIEGNYKILLTDLLPGSWQVLKDGRVLIPDIIVKEAEKTIYLEGNKGTYSLIINK